MRELLKKEDGFNQAAVCSKMELTEFVVSYFPSKIFCKYVLIVGNKKVERRRTCNKIRVVLLPARLYI